MAPRLFVLRMRRDLGGVLEHPEWPEGITCRVLDKADLKAVHAVLAAGFWEGGRGAPQYRQWWSQLRKDSEFDPALFFVAVDREGVCGLVQCWTTNFVKDLAVHPRSRRRGIGRALMLTAFHAFRKRGATHVDLRTREENADAQRLYSGLGMTVVSRDPG